MNNQFISEDQFREEWGVVQKSDGEMFYFDDVKDQPPEHVWTIVDTGSYEDENLYASPGFHVVNNLGYVMTERAWEADTPDAIYYLHEDIDDGSRTVFIYQYRDASNYKAGGMLLLHGDCGGVEGDLIRGACDAHTYFVAEQVGVPALCDQLYAFSDGPTDDDHAFHEYQGLRQATPEEISTLPLSGSLRKLTCRFLKVDGPWDCSLSPNCF